MALVKQETQRREIYPEDPRSQTAQTRDSVYAEPGKVSFIRAYYLTGINRHNQKRWFRWDSANVATVYLTKAGKVAGKRKIGKSFVSGIDFNTVTLVQNRPYIEQYIGKPISFGEVFPLADHWQIREQMQIPQGLVTAMREDDLPGMVRSAFGKTRYRRDLVKAVGKAPVNAVALARDFRGLVPTDWMIDFLRQNEAEGVQRLHTFDRWHSIRPLLFTIDPRSLHDLLRTTVNGRESREIADTLRMYRQNPQVPLPTGRYRNWSELHDYFENIVYNWFRDHEVPRVRWDGEVGQQPMTWNNARVKVIVDIPLTELGKKLDGHTEGDYRIVIPKKTDELEEWGNHMRNCIGSYGYRVTGENSPMTLGAVYKGDIPVVNFEITDNRLGQFLGRFNQSPGKELCAKFEALFQGHGIDVSEYWGKIDGAGNEW